MAGQLSSTGDVLCGKFMLNASTPVNVTLHLFTNNVSIAKSDTAASYTELAIGGYAAITMAGGTWTVTTTSGVTTASYPTQTFSFTSGTATVYGFYITSGSTLLYSENFPSGGYSVSSTAPLQVGVNITIS